MGENSTVLILSNLLILIFINQKPSFAATRA